MSKCIFCESSLDDGQEVVTLGVKGCQAFAQTSQAWGSSITTSPGQRVHVKCCHRHCNKRRIEQNLLRSHNAASDDSGGQVYHSGQVSLRSGELTFNFKENCLFCGQIDTFDSKHQRGHKIDTSQIT